MKPDGSQKYDYEYRYRIFKNNGYHVIFVHVYKRQKEWQNYLVKKTMETEE